MSGRCIITVSPCFKDLFTQVRGRGILGSSLAGSCIDRPPEPRGLPESASITAGRGLHVVVLDGYALRRIGPASAMVPVLYRYTHPGEDLRIEEESTP